MRSNFWPRSATATPGGHCRRWRSASFPATSGLWSSRASWPKNRCSARRSSTTRTGDAHYDAASALIKSIRGSDPDAALYWLARMLEAGEDVPFLARRIVISGQRGHRQCRSARFAAGGRGHAGLRVRRPAGVSIAAGPGGHVSGLCRRNQTPRRSASAKRGATWSRAACFPVPVHLKDRHYPAQASRPWRGLSILARCSRRSRQPRIIWAWSAEYYRPVPRGFEIELGERLKEIRARLKEAKGKTSADDE